MKSWKKLLALLMALAIVFTFVACDSKDDDDKDDDDDKNSSKDKDEDEDEDEDDGEELIGEWAIELDLNSYMNTALAEKFEGINGCDYDLPMIFSMEFKKSGKLTIAMHVDEDDFDGYLDAFLEVMVEYVIDYAKSNGMNETQFRSEFESRYGQTVESYYGAMLDESADSMLSSFNTSSTGYYKVEDDVIYTDKDEEDLEDVEDAKSQMEFSIKKDVLTIKSITGDEEMPEAMASLGLEFPWKLEKQ